MRLIVYILPISGKMILSNLINNNNISIERAFIPESFQTECSESLSLLTQHDISYRIPSDLHDSEIKNWINSGQYELGISIGYDKKLPVWLLDYPKYGTINLHPSLLPHYRGANPYFWVIRNLEEQTGITLHYMDQNLDTGPIIEQQTIQIRPDETMGTLFFTLNRLGIDLINQTIDDVLMTGEKPTATPQNEVQDVREAPEVTEADLRINWDTGADEVEAKIRAGNPFYGAFTTFRGSKIRIFEAERVSEDHSCNEFDCSDPSPGTIMESTQGPLVRCKDEWIRLKLVQVGQQYKSTGKEFQRREKTAFEILDRVV